MGRETGFLWLISDVWKLPESQLVTKPRERGTPVMERTGASSAGPRPSSLSTRAVSRELPPPQLRDESLHLCSCGSKPGPRPSGVFLHSRPGFSYASYSCSYSYSVSLTAVVMPFGQAVQSGARDSLFPFPCSCRAAGSVSRVCSLCVEFSCVSARYGPLSSPKAWLVPSPYCWNIVETTPLEGSLMGGLLPQAEQIPLIPVTY